MREGEGERDREGHLIFFLLLPCTQGISVPISSGPIFGFIQQDGEGGGDEETGGLLASTHSLFFPFFTFSCNFLHWHNR